MNNNKKTNNSSSVTIPGRACVKPRVQYHPYHSPPSQILGDVIPRQRTDFAPYKNGMTSRPATFPGITRVLRRLHGQPLLRGRFFRCDLATPFPCSLGPRSGWGCAMWFCFCIAHTHEYIRTYILYLCMYVYI